MRRGARNGRPHISTNPANPLIMRCCARGGSESDELRTAGCNKAWDPAVDSVRYKYSLDAAAVYIPKINCDSVGSERPANRKIRYCLVRSSAAGTRERLHRNP